jgi:hypothetical protein
MLRYLVTGMAVFVLWTSAGCPPPVDLSVYNNTDARLEVVVKTKQIAIEPGELQQIHDIRGDFVLLRNEHGQFCYKMAEIPLEYWKRTIGHVDIYVQIEADGLIYLIKPDVSLPTTDLSSQPVGFPLVPSEEPGQCS